MNEFQKPATRPTARPVQTRMRRTTLRGVPLLFGLLLAGCDLSVTNAGPMQDAQLNDPAAFEAVVAGMQQSFGAAVWRVAFVGAEVSREYVSGGRIFTTKLPATPGQLTRQDISDQFWNSSVQARWIAEDGVRRFRERLTAFDRSPLAARALIQVGFANRLLGENFCESVVNGSAAGPVKLYFERAEAAFSEALAVAQAAGDASLANAARAGRASVRVHLGDWNGAEADARTVPLNFQFSTPFGEATLDQYNGIAWSNANQPFRTHSVVGTFYESYYLETGDPRVAWGRDPAVPNAEFAAVPWLFQLKYRNRVAPIRLASGREAALILAEAELRRGQTAEALNRINALRTSIQSEKGGALSPWPTPATLAQAWTALKRERGIELWLEGRRMGDLRRWVEAETPGEMEKVTDRVRLCIPVAQSEIDTNPNVGTDHPDPTNPRFTGA
jgi:starch-binding outer membrane protein, SusD/RagB family